MIPSFNRYQSATKLTLSLLRAPALPSNVIRKASTTTQAAAKAALHAGSNHPFSAPLPITTKYEVYHLNIEEVLSKIRHTLLSIMDPQSSRGNGTPPSEVRGNLKIESITLFVPMQREDAGPPADIKIQMDVASSFQNDTERT